MDRLIPQSEYPEDQSYSRTILYSHLAHKGVQAGAIVGVVTGTIVYFFTKSGRSAGAFSTISKFSNRGAAVFPAIVMGLGFYKMRGKEDIEWKDRAWRLHRNETMKCIDTLTDVAIVGGAFIPGAPIGLCVSGSLAAGITYLKMFGKKID